MSDEWFDRFEAEWQARRNLDWLWDQLAANATSRQRRLFSLACFRSQRKRFGKQVCQVMDIVEHYADGIVGTDELATFARIAFGKHSARRNMGDLILATCTEEALAESWSRSVGNTSVRFEKHENLVGRQRLIILHEIVGNPFRDQPLDESLLAWNDSTIPNLARTIY